MTSALKNFSLNGSQIKRSNTTCTESRPSTGKSLQPRPLTTSSTAKRAQYMRKTKNEIERWAYNDDRVEIGYESDEIKSVDDDYIDKIAEKDYEEIVLDKRTMEKKQQRVHHILKNMRDAKRFYLEMAKKNPDYEFKLEVNLILCFFLIIEKAKTCDLIYRLKIFICEVIKKKIHVRDKIGQKNIEIE